MTTPSEFVAKLKRDIQTKTDLRKILNSGVLNEMGRAIVEEMREDIASGKSPISGRGKFPAYKNPDKYPGKRKRHSPVNLELTGQMLSSLKYRVNQAKVLVTIFYSNRKAQLKELGHREGAKGQPERPTVPIGDEQFTQSIRNRVQALIDKALRNASLTWKS